MHRPAVRRRAEAMLVRLPSLSPAAPCADRAPAARSLRWRSRALSTAAAAPAPSVVEEALEARQPPVPVGAGEMLLYESGWGTKKT